MTETDVNAIYEDHINLIRKVVWKFIRKTGLPPQEYEELFCEANLFFMLAITSYNKDISKFTTWLQTQLQKRLLTTLRINKREWEKIVWPRERVSKYFTRTRTPIDLRDELTRDAKVLIVLVRSGRLDLDKILFTKDGSPRYSIGIKHVFRFLRQEKGWNRVRIRRCFKNLERLLV